MSNCPFKHVKRLEGATAYHVRNRRFDGIKPAYS